MADLDVTLLQPITLTIQEKEVYVSALKSISLFFRQHYSNQENIFYYRFLFKIKKVEWFHYTHNSAEDRLNLIDFYLTLIYYFLILHIGTLRLFIQ